MQRLTPAATRARAAGDRPAPASDLRCLCAIAVMLLLLTYVPYAYGWAAGIGLLGVLCFLVWLAVVFPHVHRTIGEIVRNTGGVQIIVLILFLSAYIEGFFPSIGVRHSDLVIQSPANAVNLTRMGLIGLAGLIAIGIAYLRPGRLAMSVRGPLRWMLLYAAVAVFSSSYASFPAASAGKAAEVFVDVVCFLVLASLLYADDFLRVWNTLWLLLGLLLVSVWISSLLFPSIGFIDQPGALFPFLSGAYPVIHPDRLGQLGASLAIIGLCRLLRRGSRLFSQAGMLWGGIVMFGLATLGAAQARTSMVALALAIPVCLYLYRRLTLVTVCALATVAAVIMAYGNVVPNAGGTIEAVSQYLRRGQTPELVYSLSGRLDYWAPAWDLFSTAPVLGRGFYTAHRVDLNAIWGRGQGVDLSTVDNTYLEVLLGIGIVGFFPLLMALVESMLRIVQTLKLPPIGSRLRDGQKEMIGFFMIALVRAITGPSFHVHGESLVLMLLIMAFVQSVRDGRLTRPAAIPAGS